MSYLRIAVMGSLVFGGWPRLSAAHDVSWCDVSSAGATAYDVRRVQLREALAHRPNLVVLGLGLSYWGRGDVSDARSHLTHCAQMITRRGAVLLTTGVGRRTRWNRAQAQQLDAVYDELAERFGAVHLDRGLSSTALQTERYG